MAVVILGCGYTGRRVASQLAVKAIDVIATARNPESLAGLPVRPVAFDVSREIDLSFVPPGSTILYSIPAAVPDRTAAVVEQLEERVARVVYLSTTSVYGPAVDVDETTQINPDEPASRARAMTEAAIASGPWQTLILRPAAIYGPGRGVHVRLQRGDYYLTGDGRNFVSRIHVDDLAAHAIAGLLSSITGAYPVADEEPCTSLEITEFCALLLGVPMPPFIPAGQAHPTRRSNRRVDGSAIRRLLGISLEFPSYRTGIPASITQFRERRPRINPIIE
jgi:nucleoside-diphosphate-sugar epimerase